MPGVIAVLPKFKFTGPNGQPLANGTVDVYIAGSTTRTNTWQDQALTVLNPNPIVLDSSGECLLWLDSSITYKFVLKNAGGVEQWTVDNVTTSAALSSALQALFAASSGSSAVGFIQAGAGSVAITTEAKLRQIVNIKDKGAAPGKTNAENKAALQAAIADVGAAGGGVIVVDYDICYGLKTADRTTWPDFAGVIVPITVYDCSRGATYGTYPNAYDGAQIRNWFHTPPTTVPGQHDGGTFWLRADWAPYLCMSHDAQYAAPGHPSRTAFDHRRQALATHVKGIATNQFGQGTNVGAGWTDEEMSNIHFQKFAAPFDTIGDFSWLLGERKTSYISYGGGRGFPSAHHHFEPSFGSPANYLAMFQNPYSGTVTLCLRNSVGLADDVEIKNEDGSFVVVIPDQGEALRVSAANRYVGLGDAPSYRLDVIENRTANYIQRTRNSSTSGGSLHLWQSATTAGGTWNALNILSDNGSNLLFQFSGNGSAYADGSFIGGGADRADMFAWLDGNPQGRAGHKKEVGSNRVGHSVVLVGDKIRLALPGEVPIGIVSLTYDSLGNAAPANWAGKYIKDDFGQYLMEPCQVVTWTERVKMADAVEGVEPSIHPQEVRNQDGSIRILERLDPGRPAQPERWEEVPHSYLADQVPDGVTVPCDATYTDSQRRKVNPAFDPDAAYVSREHRKEWDAVGMLGRIPMHKGQPVAPSWVKLRDISDSVEEWLVR